MLRNERIAFPYHNKVSQLDILHPASYTSIPPFPSTAPSLPIATASILASCVALAFLQACIAALCTTTFSRRTIRFSSPSNANYISPSNTTT